MIDTKIKARVKLLFFLIASTSQKSLGGCLTSLKVMQSVPTPQKVSGKALPHASERFPKGWEVLPTLQVRPYGLEPKLSQIHG